MVARDAHLRVPPDQICPLRDAVSNQDTIDDPEDGITAEVENKLRDRKLKSGVNTWDALWATLFPEDQIPKSEGNLISQTNLPCTLTPMKLTVLILCRFRANH